VRKILIIILPLVFIALALWVKLNSNNSQALSCSASDFSGDLTDETQALFEGREINVPALAQADDDVAVLGTSSEQRWVEVDLSEQKLRAWDGNSLFLETPVSSGLPWTPTPTGEFRVWIKLRATKMEGGRGKYYYYLPNVPYVMFFENERVPGWKGYGLHGTYWHNDFGTRRSHGCVNLPTNIAEQLFYFLGPELPAGKSTVRSSVENPGGRIVIHE
jgi:hypothetical protein